VKIFLDASPEERARRRLLEQEEGADFDSVLADIKRRDHADSTRPVAPLRSGGGVHVVNTDGRSIEQIVEEIAELATKTWQHVNACANPGIAT
jgi:cytidylate kinase